MSMPAVVSAEYEAKSPVIGLGGAGVLGSSERLADDAAAAVITSALESGVRYFDTSPLYGDGLSESRLGEALQGSDLGAHTVATKVGLYHGDDGSLQHRWSRVDVARSLEASLRRLRRTHLDVVQLHELLPQHWDEVFAPGGALSVLRAWQSEGVIGVIGVTSSDVGALLRAMQGDEFPLVQMWRRWNLLDRTGEPVLDRASATGRRLVIGGPFASGILADPHRGPLHYAAPSADMRRRVLKLARDAGQAGHDLPEHALRFCLDSRVSVVLVGADTPEHVRSAQTAWERSTATMNESA